MKKYVVALVLCLCVLAFAGRGRYDPMFWRAVPGGIEYTGGDVTVSGGNLVSSGGVKDLIPDANNTYDLGSATNYWKELYLMGSSLHIGRYTLKQDVADDDGLELDGALHTAVVAGKSGNLCIHEGNEPTASSSATGNRLWTDPNGVLRHQKSSNAGGGSRTIIVDDGSGNVSITGYLEASEVRAKDANGLKLYDDGGNGIFVEDGGQIGIGITTPLELLHIEGNNAALRLQDDSGNWARIKAGDSQLTLEADPDNEVASTDIVFKMDGAEVARFYQGGNFGIGVVYPDAELEVNGYTMLGSDAPKIKVKKLTGTLAPAGSNLRANDYADKVLFAIPVVLSGGMYLPPEYTGNANMKYSFYWNTTNFTFRGVDAGIDSSPYVITVIYEE